MILVRLLSSVRAGNSAVQVNNNNEKLSIAFLKIVVNGKWCFKVTSNLYRVASDRKGLAKSSTSQRQRYLHALELDCRQQVSHN